MINNKVFEIAAALKAQVNVETEDPGLMTGLAGISLFFYELGKATQQPEYGEQAELYLGAVFEKINNGFNYPTFCGGLAGIGWLVKYYVKEGFLDAENLEVLNGFDDYLYKCMLNFLDDKNYDYLHGAVGIGLYFLSRLPDPNAVKALEELVAGLDKIALHDKTKGWSWWEVVDSYDDNKVKANFSLSHGMAAIANFLGRCVKAEVAQEKSLKLLNANIRYLLDNRNPEGIESFFPSYLSKSGDAREARLAWCYGDPGFCTALWQTARIIAHQELENICLQAILKAAECRDVQQARVMDAGICHGSAGLTLIMSIMYKNSDTEIFKSTADFWLQVTLELAKRPAGLAGYQAWHGAEKSWQTESALLEGVAGIGLSLLISQTTTNHLWTEQLLLS